MSTPPSGSPQATGERTFEGVVDRITYESEKSGFRVLKVTDKSGRGVAVVGKMQSVPAGSRVRVTGQWESDPRHGEQFRADTVLVLDPDTREGIERYLGSGLIPGIGPALAKRIVAQFGEQTLEVMDGEPRRLDEVPGLGQRRVASIVEAWSQQRSLREVMVFLQGHGISPSLAARVYQRYGSESIRVVSDNPFRLAEDVWGVGFRKADQIARNVGFAREAPERLQAAVMHALSQSEERGHVFAPTPELVQAATETAGANVPLVERAVDDVCAGPNARSETLPDVGDVVYRSRRFIEECGLAQPLA